MYLKVEIKYREISDDRQKDFILFMYSKVREFISQDEEFMISNIKCNNL